MSAEQQQQQQIQHRIQKCSPSLLNKQGPLKATIPMSSVLKQNSCLKIQTSPTLSPNASWKVRMSPEHVSGQRSPGSANYKGKQQCLSNTLHDFHVFQVNNKRLKCPIAVLFEGQHP